MKLMKFFLIFMLFFTMAISEDKEEDDIAKMVYHCDFNDDARYKLMLSNIRFSIDYYNANLTEYDIRVVANSECIRYLFKNKAKKLLAPPVDLKKNIKAKALNYDIGFYVCGNTLDAFKINKKNIEPYATIVKSGVVEVTKLQQRENFGYIKVR